MLMYRFLVAFTSNKKKRTKSQAPSVSKWQRHHILTIGNILKKGAILNRILLISKKKKGYYFVDRQHSKKRRSFEQNFTASRFIKPRKPSMKSSRNQKITSKLRRPGEIAGVGGSHRGEGRQQQGEKGMRKRGLWWQGEARGKGEDRKGER